MAATAHGVLTPNVITTVTITSGGDGIVVVNRPQTGVIWVRIDGENPVAEGPDTYAVFGARSFELRRPYKPVTVKLLCTAANAYSVEAE